MLMLISCSSRSSIRQDAIQHSPSKTLALSTPWIKDEDENFDMQLRLQNQTDQFIIVLLSDIRCSRGNVLGEITHSFFNTGERTIDLKPNETKKMTMVCRFSDDVKGDFSIKVVRIYANPAKDGKTLGDVIDKDVVLDIKESGLL
jgi:hypothetical protein